MDKETQTKLRELKRKYRKKAEEFRFTLRFARNLYSIDFINERTREHYRCSIELFAGVLIVKEFRNLTVTYVANEYKEKVKKLALDYWIEFADILNMKLIISAIKHPHLKKITKEEVSKLKLISEAISENWEFKELKKGYKDEIIGILLAFKNELLKLKEEDATFSYHMIYLLCFSEISAYYKGLHGKFLFEKEEEYYKIIFLDEEITFQTKEELKNKFSTMMKKVENKQRLKNILNPLRYHFEKLIERRISYSEEVKEKIYNELLKKLPPEKIEEEAAKKEMNLKVIKFDMSGNIYIKFFELAGTFFIYEIDKALHAYPFEEYQKAKTHFDTLILEYIQNQNKETFDYFEEKSKEMKLFERSI